LPFLCSSRDIFILLTPALVLSASFVAGNVFFEIVFSSISFTAAPVYAYFTLASLSFAVATIVLVIGIIVPVALSNVHSAGGAKDMLMRRLQPLVQLSYRCCILHTLLWTASLFVWGPIKFPPFSWMSYSLPALALLLMTQQLHDIRRSCLRCARDCKAEDSAEAF
jgi:hypothetical protein